MAPEAEGGIAEARGGTSTAWARTRWAGALRTFIWEWVFGPIVRTEIGIEVRGLENLRSLGGPVIFVANHTSHLDATVILGVLPRHVRARTAVGAAKDYFFDVWWRRTFTSLVYAGFPVERGGGERATEVARALLGQGWNLVVFPEGSRSPDGWMKRFRHGASRLAIDARVAIVPIAMIGAYAAMPKGRWWPMPGRPPVLIVFGAPIRAEEGERHQDLSLRVQRTLAGMLDAESSAWWGSLPERHRATTSQPMGPELPRWSEPGPEPND